MSTNVLGFRNQATVSFWALDSLPSQLNENSYPERPKWAVSHSLEPGFDFGKSTGSYSTLCLQYCLDNGFSIRQMGQTQHTSIVSDVCGAALGGRLQWV